ncbi:N-acetylmuramoyl-L-alanine amidase CwlD [Halalkalibacillus sediminis]|uniref:N-acetylmuramoyl-L-alanine amidase CwlD n=1 Tax=Halalkalibacillus sediminis TaxID=2018042 RepID=A0A2I0QR38_9BACI|nr:N-acetylmuramoyl-L-alanine amidase CwlD [Halalkalibacillus sediminis]PKR76540.1 N-acetylmuramoyl-L-alanine amidase CwlD [Halalkalibacillus sediminis]
MKRFWLILLWLVGLILLIYLLRYPIDTIFTTTKGTTTPLAGKVIVLDPGHGGVDGGADYEDIQEKSIAFQTTLFLRDYLQGAGATVYLTREKDVDLAPTDMKGYSKRKSYDIRKRVDFVNEKEADLFISVHLNSIPNNQWRGAQAFYYPNDENKELAMEIQKRMNESANKERSALPIQNIYILKHTDPVGALLEIGFLSNSEERSRLINEDYQREMASSIYEGIVEYLVQKD